MTKEIQWIFFISRNQLQAAKCRVICGNRKRCKVCCQLYCWYWLLQNHYSMLKNHSSNYFRHLELFFVRCIFCLCIFFFDQFRPDHNFRPKKYHFLFLLPFDADAFKTCKNTIKLINLCALPCQGLFHT